MVCVLLVVWTAIAVVLEAISLSGNEFGSGPGAGFALAASVCAVASLCAVALLSGEGAALGFGDVAVVSSSPSQGVAEFRTSSGASEARGVVPKKGSRISSIPACGTTG
mgnify:CR=1 FL=1